MGLYLALQKGTRSQWLDPHRKLDVCPQSEGMPDQIIFKYVLIGVNNVFLGFGVSPRTPKIHPTSMKDRKGGIRKERPSEV